ncbi:MAG: DUF1679 domain-containing protein [Actinomyces sp.]|nr:MAG: DUF1679 domain-containing protein [Actinomyces sp.]
MTTPDPAILDDPALVEPSWLTAVLAAAGLPDGVEVVGIEREPVGTGQMAHNERFVLTYRDPARAVAAGAPPSLVGKFPSPSEESRAAGAAGGYRNEVRFYRELAPRLAVRTPRCWYAAVNDDSTSFTLLLEDLAPAVAGDQLAGATPDQVRAAAENLAGLHAPLWGADELADLGWLRSSLADQTVEIVRLVVPLFCERYADRMSDDARRVCETFAEHVDRWLDREPGPPTLVHGDYRLDNLLFGDADDPVVAVDWQTVAVACGGRDLAYLVGTSLDPGPRRRHEAAVLDAYRRAMATLGVELDAATVAHHHRHGSFQGPFITMLGAIAVERTPRGDDMFMAMLHRSCDQILDLGALDLLR